MQWGWPLLGQNQITYIIMVLTKSGKFHKIQDLLNNKRLISGFASPSPKIFFLFWAQHTFYVNFICFAAPTNTLYTVWLGLNVSPFSIEHHLQWKPV